MLETFDTFRERVGLKAGTLPNPGKPIELAPLQADLKAAVQHMQTHMEQRQQAFANGMDERLHDTLRNLEQLQQRQIEQLELRLDKQGGLENLRQGRRDRRVGQIRRVFDEYETWVRDSLQTEPHPYIQVLAALAR